MSLLKFGTVMLALVLFALVYARYAPAQEYAPLPLLAPRTTEPLPYLYQTRRTPIGVYPIYPYNPVYRGRLYEFTGHIVNGVPVYRRLP